MKDLILKLKSLKKDVLKYIILVLLYEKKLDYTELSELYVKALEEEKKEKHTTIFSMSIPLCHYFIEHKGKKKQDVFMKSRTAYNLLKSDMFRKAPIEKKFKEWIEKNPYNEDEHGNPIINQ